MGEEVIGGIDLRIGGTLGVIPEEIMIDRLKRDLLSTHAGGKAEKCGHYGDGR